MERRTASKALTVAILAILAGCSSGVPLGKDAEADMDIRFREVATDAGVNYTASRTAAFGNGRAGVYVTDFNNDGWPDVLATGGEKPVLFENLGGAFERSGVLPAVNRTVKGALFFDYDTDGWDDLLLLPVEGQAVLLENQNGTFRTRDVGLGAKLHIAIAVTTADYNRDGCLDLLVAQTGDWRREIPAKARRSYSRDDPIDSDTGNPNLLFTGNCSSFEHVDADVEGARWSLAASFVDLSGDGWPDIHVANDFNSDVLYLNRHNGTFEQRKLPATDRHGMASEVADMNGDQHLDVFVTNIHYNRSVWTREQMRNMDNRGNNLLINQGNGTFASKERAYGVRNGGWGWAASLIDLDNDGERDLVHTTKDYLYDSNGDGAPERFETRPRLWKRTGATFTRLNASRAGFDPTSGRGIAHFDYDRDGDQDLVVAAHDGAFKLYENRAETGNWLQIRLAGDAHRPVLGSRVTVTAENETHYRVLNARADFLSQESRVLHVGLDKHDTATIQVRWPDGTTRTVEHVDANQRLVIPREGPIRSQGTD